MLRVALLLVVVVQNRERPALSVVLFALAYEKHARFVIQVFKQAFGLTPRRARKEPLLGGEIVYGRDVVERHVAGLFGAHVLGEPPVRMTLVDHDQVIVLLDGHVVFGGALVVEQRDVVWLLAWRTHAVHSVCYLSLLLL